MKGMHCLVCKENGPDLTIQPGQLPPPGMKADIRLGFQCGNCGLVWEWRVTQRADGSLTYIAPDGPITAAPCPGSGQVH